MREDINGRPIRTISKRQREAIEWLASGRQVDEVASLIQIPAALVRQWQREDQLFRLVLQTRRLDPRPPQVDFLDQINRRLDAPDQGEPWTSEATEED